MDMTRTTQRSVCAWDEDEDGTWHTDCGNLFEVIDGTPAENKMKFCCYCGAALAACFYRSREDWDDEDAE